jgi:2-polyprenyl-3-methyl-5-hydroxy-6-metoxy-1,4-benzoquinol methylase
MWWPDRVHGLLTAYQTSAILKASIELDLFRAFSGLPLGPDDLAKHCAADERGMRILCDTLTVLGLLEKTAGRYSPAPGSACFLDSSSPSYLGDSALFWLAPELMARWDNLTEYIRHGGATDEGTIAPNNPLWVKFAAGMGRARSLQAELLAQLILARAAPRKVLDVAAGHGAFGLALATHAPDAVITANDWPTVLEVAKRHAAAAGVADRFRLLEGDALQVDYGCGYDAVLLSNFLHHFDRSTCELLLRKAYNALVRNGMAVVVDFVPNEDRVSPHIAALCAINMLVETPRGDAHTQVEVEDMCRAVGFNALECHDLPPTPHRAIIGRKR